jgi:prophage regulatory protein
MKKPQHSDPTSRRILRRPGLITKTGLSYPTLWRYERDGKFPQRVQLGPNSVGWFEDEVDEWLASRQRGVLPVEDLNVRAASQKLEGTCT